MNDKTTDPAEKMPEEEKVSRHFIEREIELDERLTPAQNAQRMYKKYILFFVKFL